MIGDVAEAVAELIGLAVYPLVASALTVVGALAEFAGVQNLQTGHSMLGAWEIFIGLIALYAALNLVREFVLPQLRGEEA